jgi:hypothetical protein
VGKVVDAAGGVAGKETFGVKPGGDMGGDAPDGAAPAGWVAVEDAAVGGCHAGAVAPA